jgi:hypothetical protein
MSTSEYYRQEAERCRERALASPNADAARRWPQIADEYDQLANSSASVAPAQQARRSPMQPQEIQQQQTRAEPDDNR